MTNQKMSPHIKKRIRPHYMTIMHAVLDGTKPTALIHKVFEKEIKESGLHYEKLHFDQIVVAKTKKKVEDMVDLHNRFLRLHEELGLKLGFPHTAVQAFMGKTKAMFQDEKIPKKYQGFFAFSVDHFAEEKKVIDKWHDSAKKRGMQ